MPPTRLVTTRTPGGAVAPGQRDDHGLVRVQPGQPGIGDRVAKQGRLADGGQAAVEGSRRVEVDGLHHLPQVAGPDAGPQPGAARLDRAEQQRRGLGPDDLAGAGQHVDGDARRVVGTLDALVVSYRNDTVSWRARSLVARW